MYGRSKMLYSYMYVYHIAFCTFCTLKQDLLIFPVSTRKLLHRVKPHSAARVTFISISFLLKSPSCLFHITVAVVLSTVKLVDRHGFQEAENVGILLFWKPCTVVVLCFNRTTVSTQRNACTIIRYYVCNSIYVENASFSREDFFLLDVTKTNKQKHKWIIEVLRLNVKVKVKRLLKVRLPFTRKVWKKVNAGYTNHFKAKATRHDVLVVVCCTVVQNNIFGHI